MRRWVCIIALLTGFTSSGYVHAARVRIPAPIERPLESVGPTSGLRPALAWWQRR